MQAIIDAEVEKMEHEEVIEPAHGARSSPVVIVKKKTDPTDFVSISAG